jgi:hypothetical protein
VEKKVLIPEEHFGTKIKISDFTHIRAYHACRIEKLDSYMLKGICPFNYQEALDKITRQLMGWGVPDAEEIEAKFKFRWDEKEQSIHKVWLELSKQVLQEEAAQYLKFGSELLSAVAYDFNLQYKLQTFGIPYIVLCEVPLSRISEWFLQSIPDAIIAGDGGFPIDRIYPDEIISFEKHNEFTKSLVC